MRLHHYLACLLSGLLSAGWLAAAKPRPNFIFFLTDDISYRDLGCYGNTFVQTPHLDQIAREGLVFDRAYLTISSCSPSRCSMITGRYPHNTGAPELHTRLPADQHTFIQDLKQAGYYTVLAGKNHMGVPTKLGFDYSTDSAPSGAEKWVSLLQQRPKDKPFFCWFASHDAHRDWQLNDKAHHFTPDEIEVAPMMYDGPLTREDLTGYYHEVSRTDYYAGQIMSELEKQGIRDNTYFIYCSDNGRPFPRCKTYLYESGIQTPLIVTGPGIQSGRTNSLVSSIDYAATILELAGIDKPDSIQGVSFATILKDPSVQIRQVVFAERNWHVFRLHERMVRMGNWLYIWNAWPDHHNVSAESSAYDYPAVKELWDMAEKGKLTPAQHLLTEVPQPREMLFRVDKDPFQFENLAQQTEHRAVLNQMRELLARWKAQTGDSVQKHPTPDRQSLHKFDGNQKTLKRGDFPGSDKGAEHINHPGPLTL